MKEGRGGPASQTVQPLRSMPTLMPLANEYLRRRVARGEISRQTAQDFRYPLAGFARSYGARPLDKLGPKAIDRWLETIGHQMPATRRHRLSIVRGFCQWMVREGFIRKDPTSHVPPIRQPRRVPVTLHLDEVQQLLQRGCPDTRARAVAWLMVGCGLRCVEVSRLTNADYDRRARTLIIVGKGGHQRIIPVPDSVAAAIDAYQDDEGGRAAGPMFRSRLDGTSPLSPRTVSIYMRKWMKKAGVKTQQLDGRSAHGLRRTAASDVMDRSGDVRIVQAMLGHVRIETTAAYLRPVPLDRMREAMEGRDYLPAA